MIIDMRLRPPLPEFLQDGPIALYSPRQIDLWSKYLGTRVGAAAKEQSLDLFFQEMNEAGIDKGIIHARKINGIRNETIRDFVQSYPEQFIGCINEMPKVEGTENCLEQIDEYVINGCCQGVFMEPTLDTIPWNMADETVFPIYEKCAEYNIPILFTIGGLSLNLSTRNKLFPAMDTIASTFPNLKITVCHGGWPAVEEVVQMAAFRGNIFISQDLYLINSPFQQDYIQAENYMLSDRILYGSAYPAADMRDAVAFYKNCGFKEDVLPRVMGENAAQLFDGKPVDSLVQRAFSGLTL